MKTKPKIDERQKPRLRWVHEEAEHGFAFINIDSQIPGPPDGDGAPSTEDEFIAMCGWDDGIAEDDYGENSFP